MREFEERAAKERAEEEERRAKMEADYLAQLERMKAEV